MEKLLAQFRIPKANVLTLERLVNLFFVDIIHEIVIVLLPQELSKLEVGLNLSNLMIGEHFNAKITPLSKKRKSLE